MVEHEPPASGGRALIVGSAALALALIGLLALSMTPGTSSDEAARSLITAAALRAPSDLPVVAPVSPQGMALATETAVADRSTFDARLPTGQVVHVSVVSDPSPEGLTMVSLPDGVTVATFLYGVAGAGLEPDDTVLVHSADPYLLSVRELVTTRLSEGTPLTDAEGRLLGMCSLDGDSTEVMPVAAPSTAVSVAAATVAGG